MAQRGRAQKGRPDSDAPRVDVAALVARLGCGAACGLFVFFAFVMRHTGSSLNDHFGATLALCMVIGAVLMALFGSRFQDG